MITPDDIVAAGGESVAGVAHALIGGLGSAGAGRVFGEAGEKPR